MVVNEDGLITENQNTLDNVQVDTNSINDVIIKNTEEPKPEVIQDENFDLESNEQLSNNLSVSVNGTKELDDTNLTTSDPENKNQTVVALKSTDEETANTTCLALTVRKSYNLSIVKNSIFTTLRVSWKVALSTFVLNILKLFF